MNGSADKADLESEESELPLNGDDDRDFDFGDHNAQRALEGFMAAEGGVVRCNWLDPEIVDERLRPYRKKARTDPIAAEEGEKAGLAQFRTAAGDAARIQLRGPVFPEAVVREKASHPPRLRAAGILKGVAESLVNRLAVLRIDNFPGSGDPVFGTQHELRRGFRAPDLFGGLAAAFQGHVCCGLTRLTLQGGFHSADSVANFLRLAKPPLQSFRCRGCLFHGRNFEMLVKALSSVAADLIEFETDATIGGQDPFGLIAASFPNLRMLRAKNIFGSTNCSEGLQRLEQLEKKQCRLPKDSHRLYGRPAVHMETGVVYWGITSDYHDDGFHGEGIWWDDLEIPLENYMEWRVGNGVTQAGCLQFMEECGIQLWADLEDDAVGINDAKSEVVDSDVEPDHDFASDFQVSHSILDIRDPQ